MSPRSGPSANALAWTLFLLSEFPEADAVVAAEAAALGAAPDADDLERLTGTRMILEESMRLYPPVPFLSRGVVARDRIGDVEVTPAIRVIIAPWVSGVVFIIGSEMTQRRLAERAVETLLTSRPHVLGAVLNRVDIIRNKYYYSRYYGYKYKNYYVRSNAA